MAQGRKTSLRIALDQGARHELESWQRSTTIPTGLARRGRIILLLADGEPISEISRMVGIERRHVYKWAERFVAGGAHALQDRPGRGRKRKTQTPGQAKRAA